jgi:hypothetical protein
MKIKLSNKDVKDLIIEHIRDTNQINGEFDVDFVINRKFVTAPNPNHSDYAFVFEGAEVVLLEGSKSNAQD